MNVRRFGNKKNRQIVPDLTPLIDVVFLLLIFFMVATTFDDMGGMRIDLPKSGAAVKYNDIDKISVLLAKDNKVMIKSIIAGVSKTEDADASTLKVKLEDMIERSADGRVGILADREIDYGNVVDIMTIAREAGAASIDIETKRK